MRKRVIVTGGCGFIGSHVVDRLIALDYDVCVVDSLTYAGNKNNISEAKQSVHFRGLEIFDIGNKEEMSRIISEFVPGMIINLAAETHVDNSITSVSQFIKTNVESTANLLEVCAKSKTPICHISTDEIYGPSYGSKPFVETDPHAPQNPYAATKSAAEHLVVAFGNTHGLDYRIIRPSNNFGPRQNIEKFIPKFLSSLNQNKKFGLYGDGRQEREWLYVEDSARFIVNIARDAPNRTVLNIGTGNMHHNIDIARKIVENFYEHDIKIEEYVSFIADRPGHDKRYWIDCSAAKADGFIDIVIPFESALKETIKFYRNHK